MHSAYRKTFKHDFGQGAKTSAEKRTLVVMILTFVTMFAEIAAGLLTKSMALFADGIHMGGHALALGLAFLGYFFVRKYANDRRFVFGSGKINELIAYSTSILLILTTVFIFYESVTRLIHPEPILAMEAFTVAFIGLVINLVSAYILHGAEGGHEMLHMHSHGHDHGHDHDHAHHHEHAHEHHHDHDHEHGECCHGHDHEHHHDHEHGECCHEHEHEREHEHEHEHVHEHHEDEHAHEHGACCRDHGHEHAHNHVHSHGHAHASHMAGHDHNLQGALMHVLADAATSVAAMIGIVCAWVWQWYWVDPLIALIASFVIGKWAIGLMKDTSAMLLDADANQDLQNEIIKTLTDAGDTEVVDLHVWAVGHNAWTMVASVVHHGELTPKDYKKLLSSIEGLHHPIVEVQICRHKHCEGERDEDVDVDDDEPSSMPNGAIPKASGA